MGNSFCLVVNPAAARGRCKRHLPGVLDVLAAAGAGIRVSETASLGHATELAAGAAGRGETVVAVGGDGLVGTLAAAVSGAGGLLGIIPAGRGNDFAHMLGIPASPVDAAAALLTGEPRAVDLIGVRAGDGPEQVVAGSVYLGVVSEGGEVANQHRWAAGPLGYQVAGVRALLGWRPATFTVDPGPAGGPQDCPGFTVVIANCGYLAAGVKAAPAADVSDGLLDVIIVGHGRKLSFLRVMLRAGQGTHTELAQVSAYQAAAVTVTTDRAMPVAADGETLAGAAPLGAGQPLHVRVLPGALRVITPAGSGGAAVSAQSPERTWWPRWPPPRKDSTKSGLADSSAGVPSIRTSPPPST
jgi:YegS/Rv2252/BmrU family lipid kinase